MRARAYPLAAACLLAITSRTAGQDAGRESLTGLNGLWVIVEDLSDEAQKGGLRRDALQTYLEMRLRRARISVLSKAEWSVSEREPYLYLNVGALRVKAGGVREGWTYTLSLEVKQRACIQGWPEGRGGVLMFPGGCSLFTTWETTGQSVTPDNLADSVRGYLAELMDELVNDYLAVNP